MNSNFPLKERSIRDIYLESENRSTYVIPIYQRNYAWGDDEITALVKDIYDSIEYGTNKPYYIGTLVTFKRPGQDNVYEVIDGQQRLTTIYILLTVLAAKFADKCPTALEFKNLSSRLTYSARKVSAFTIENLADYESDKKNNFQINGVDGDKGILEGFKFAVNAITDTVADKDMNKFVEFLKDGVHIIHYEVPKDVDLNHYFEVMNSRGEQLEQHEIVKSLMSKLLDKSDIDKFSRIWEACSKMNIYIQQAIDDKETVFDYSSPKIKVDSFDAIPHKDGNNGKNTILNLLNGQIKEPTDNSNKGPVDKFQPIIDFSNFLLIVLKQTIIGMPNFNLGDFRLDDKELLKEFKSAIDANKNADFAKKFAFNLLKARFFLDNFIVHHIMDDNERPGDNPWKLEFLHLYSKDNKQPKNLANDRDTQLELVHLLSMFEVSFTPKQRKNYLFYCMLYLFGMDNFDENNYLKFLQTLADQYFFGVYLQTSGKQPAPNAFDNALLKDGKLIEGNLRDNEVDYRKKFTDVYKQGSADIPLFVFNYMDYRLWKDYANELRGEGKSKGSRERKAFFDKLGCGDFELYPFDAFYFSRTRKSLEHYYPQAKAKNEETSENLSFEQINCFGNFAMIGADANSSGSNWDPKTKLDHYVDSKSNPVSVASLKFKIMMQMCRDNVIAKEKGELQRPQGMDWNFKDIESHQSKMLDILFR